MIYQGRITIEPGKCGGRPCIRNMRITVYDVLSYLASGMTTEEVHVPCGHQYLPPGRHRIHAREALAIHSGRRKMLGR